MSEIKFANVPENQELSRGDTIDKAFACNDSVSCPDYLWREAERLVTKAVWNGKCATYDKECTDPDRFKLARPSLPWCVGREFIYEMVANKLKEEKKDLKRRLKDADKFLEAFARNSFDTDKNDDKEENESED